jgi:hypothetical protein
MIETILVLGGAFAIGMLALNLAAAALMVVIGLLICAYDEFCMWRQRRKGE